MLKKFLVPLLTLVLAACALPPTYHPDAPAPRRGPLNNDVALHLINFLPGGEEVTVEINHSLFKVPNGEELIIALQAPSITPCYSRVTINPAGRSRRDRVQVSRPRCPTPQEEYVVKATTYNAEGLLCGSSRTYKVYGDGSSYHRDREWKIQYLSCNRS